MKDKTLAALLAFFGGSVGLHRFYLGQNALGILYICLFFVTWIVGIIDAIKFLTMDQKTFDLRYNQEAFTYANDSRGGSRTRAMTDRERKFEQRQRERAARQQRQQPKQRATTTSATRQSGPDGRAEREAGIRYFKDFEYARAIQSFQRALEINPRDVASHFNIAVSYSVEEDADQAFFHLDRAVALGFQDLDRIRTHENLAFLRIQPEFPGFADNGFRLVADLRQEELELPTTPLERKTAPPPPRENGDLLDQLQRLANLREKGLLTEGEFAAQKKRLLG